jgi:hypothetical protein
MLILVDPCAVQVPVSSPQRCRHGCPDLPALALPAIIDDQQHNGLGMRVNKAGVRCRTSCMSVYLRHAAALIGMTASGIHLGGSVLAGCCTRSAHACVQCGCMLTVPCECRACTLPSGLIGHIQALVPLPETGHHVPLTPPPPPRHMQACPHRLMARDRPASTNCTLRGSGWGTSSSGRPAYQVPRPTKGML